jgi:xanthine dehydrogenase YagT iron-sulfur-binding subunit
MSEKEKDEKTKGISRRKFLKDAGLVVGGATVGSMAILSACKGETTTVTSTKTVTTTVTSPGGTTTAPGATSTVTVTSPPVTKVVETTPAGVVTLTVNGQNYVVKVEPEWSLGFVLRDKLGLTGTKVSCDRGECGACTILVDGRKQLACTMLAIESEGKKIVTIEGLASGPNMHPVQKLFLDNQTFQCGYCTPGMIMSTVDLLSKTPKPTVDQVREALSGNLCYCGDYTRVVATVLKGGQ